MSFSLKDYISEGCPADIRDEALLSDNEDFLFDDLPWTYWTNFGITAVSVSAFIVLLFFPRSQNQEGEEDKIKVAVRLRNKEAEEFFIPLIFLSAAIAFFLGGISHLTNNPGRALFTSAYVVYGVSGGTVMVMTGLTLIGVSRTSASLVRKILWWVLSCAYAVLSLLGVIVDSAVIIGLSAFGVTAFVGIAYMVKFFEDRIEGKHFIVKAFSQVISLIGSVGIVIFQPSCGGLEAYKQCFDKCPFPKGFNQNAFYHISVMIGLIIWACSEYVRPTIMVNPQKTFEKIESSDSKA